MSESRTIKLWMNSVEKSQLQESQQTKRQQAVAGGARRYFPDENCVDLHAAIGYLSTWNMIYGHVDIYTKDTKDPELLAVYRNEIDGPVGYVICAVMVNGEYTFHS